MSDRNEELPGAGRRPTTAPAEEFEPAAALDNQKGMPDAPPAEAAVSAPSEPADTPAGAIAGTPAADGGPSWRPGEETPGEMRPGEETPGEERPGAATEPSSPLSSGGSRYRGLAAGLAIALLLVLALVGTAPFWAPLLPWGGARDDSEMIARIDRLETGQRQLEATPTQIAEVGQQQAATRDALSQLEQRTAALETKPPQPPPEFAEMRQQIATLSAGIADLAARIERQGQSVEAQAAGQMSRLDSLETSLRGQQSAAADLAARLQALEKAGRSRADNLSDLGLALSLLQIHNAVEAGRPFTAEYNVLAALAKGQPELMSAAAPLAEASQTGVAGRSVLAQRLRDLGKQIAAAAAPASPAEGGGWAGAALERLQRLVRVRRAEDVQPGREAEAAVTVAERAIAGGDIARAVAAVETLQGPAAASAAPWLRMAHQRLAVDAALQRLEALLTARLGDTAAVPGSSG
jgi:hypothetical protein